GPQREVGQGIAAAIRRDQFPQPLPVLGGHRRLGLGGAQQQVSGQQRRGEPEPEPDGGGQIGPQLGAGLDRGGHSDERQRGVFQFLPDAGASDQHVRRHGEYQDVDRNTSDRELQEQRDRPPSAAGGVG